MNAPMPALYIPHGGGPCFFMEWTMGPRDTWDKMASWLRSIAGTVDKKPAAILVISAHWEETEFTVYKHDNPGLYYDYYGFPEHTYEITYPAGGSSALALRVEQLFTSAGIPIRFNESRGFDHGVFIPFKLIFPDADIPIVQVSLKKGLDPAQHIEAGRALAPLRDEGILIAGSGMSYHNMRGLMSGADRISDSAVFDDWLTSVVQIPEPDTRNQKLIHWENAPAARSAHPREEHLLPLMVISGAAGRNIGKRVFSDEVLGCRVSAYQFN